MLSAVHLFKHKNFIVINFFDPPARNLKAQEIKLGLRPQRLFTNYLTRKVFL